MNQAIVTAPCTCTYLVLLLEGHDIAICPFLLLWSEAEIEGCGLAWTPWERVSLRQLIALLQLPEDMRVW